jgi:hypothetical protein
LPLVDLNVSLARRAAAGNTKKASRYKLGKDSGIGAARPTSPEIAWDQQEKKGAL